MGDSAAQSTNALQEVLSPVISDHSSTSIPPAHIGDSAAHALQEALPSVIISNHSSASIPLAHIPDPAAQYAKVIEGVLSSIIQDHSSAAVALALIERNFDMNQLQAQQNLKGPSIIPESLATETVFELVDSGPP